MGPQLLRVAKGQLAPVCFAVHSADLTKADAVASKSLPRGYRAPRYSLMLTFVPKKVTMELIPKWDEEGLTMSTEKLFHENHWLRSP